MSLLSNVPLPSRSKVTLSIARAMFSVVLVRLGISRSNGVTNRLSLSARLGFSRPPVARMNAGLQISSRRRLSSARSCSVAPLIRAHIILDFPEGSALMPLIK